MKWTLRVVTKEPMGEGGRRGSPEGPCSVWLIRTVRILGKRW